MAVFSGLGHELTCDGLLLETSDTLLQMAGIARRNNEFDADHKVFYSHLTFNCTRIRNHLQSCPKPDGKLTRQALGHLNSLLPEEGLEELSSYFVTAEERLGVLNMHWKGARNQEHHARVKFINRWLMPGASERQRDILDQALENCVDYLCKSHSISQPRAYMDDISLRVPGLSEPSFAVRKAAQSIFNALQNCKECSCSCPHDFGAKLELGTYRSPSKPAKRKRKRLDEGAASASLNFDMFLSMEQKWHEVRIRAIEKPPVVGFRLPGEESLPSRNQTATQRQRIEKLCAPMIKTRSKPLQRLDLKLSGDQLFEEGFFEKTNFRIDKAAKAISLALCLEEHQEWFTEKTKRVLSLIVGYTVFHLNNTSWLQPGWGSSNIKFFRTTSQEVPLRPFIETQLDLGDSGREDAGTCDGFFSQDLDSTHLCPALVSLAVILMEVYFVKSFSKMAEIHRIPLINNLDGHIALIDVEQVFNGVGEEDEDEQDTRAMAESWDPVRRNQQRGTKREEGWRSYIPEDCLYLLAAIDNCLDSELWETGDGQALDPQSLRSRIYQEVIRPLELHLTHGFSSIRLDSVDKHARDIDFARWGRVTRSKEVDQQEDMEASLPPRLSKKQNLGSTASLAPVLESESEPHTMGPEHWQKSSQPDSLSSSAFGLSFKSAFSTALDSAQFFDNELVTLEGTRKYNNWRDRYREVYEKFISKHLSSFSAIPVRIAILDTGIDRDHPVFDAYGDLKGIQNFYDESRSKKVPDAHGHGTFAASLILDYAPDADLYVIKIADRDSMRPNAQVVKKAIDHAVDVWQVDIISMSFGWPSSDFDGFNDLQGAIDRAYSKKVLMLAAASNNGGNSGRAYPASSPHVICVHSTDTYGNMSKFSPTPEAYTTNIATVGESILSAWPALLCPETEDKGYLVSRSGTSYATPILAGIVAFLLQYARLHLPEAEALRMKRKENMEALLKRCAGRGPNYNDARLGYLYVQLSMENHNLFGRDLNHVNYEILQTLTK